MITEMEDGGLAGSKSPIQDGLWYRAFVAAFAETGFEGKAGRIAA